MASTSMRAGAGRLLEIVECSECQTSQRAASAPDHSLDMCTWGTEDVVQCIQKLALSKDYGDIIRTEAIDGAVLQTMGDEDWKGLGAPFGDRRKILVALQSMK
eukprot:NODE_3658_length_747_cov_120.988539_g2842_i1.p1 GENE.NODE_3658_length_747_cov_120.988539_g2842_i1~~NODE_3658_length_747_cov_120.988539_g2842_i1.p1  ORF type:complete len:103 (-),score=8.83 NODE_3658_length_747_cov_120.988539_g2842_i1:31-339(-)